MIDYIFDYDRLNLRLILDYITNCAAAHVPFPYTTKSFSASNNAFRSTEPVGDM